MNEVILKGGCLCGAVRYTFSGTPLSSTLCFCRSCRLASGSASVAWFTGNDIQLELRGTAPQIFKSSSAAERAFCPFCGTPLLYKPKERPGTVEITTATLDNPELIRPTEELWLSHKISWAVSDPDLKHSLKDGHG
ncbi:GFA family protein [Pseudomonas syringae]|uniref:GFA family protein n=1 Tax=Pseudomonas syringae TaxID=317 RepID=A0A6B2AUM9_PSESX|nr:GFA family protein [Pseudomonas syringae]NAO43403.1 GFA family protein [Pseudomonas syringae]NAO62008.1 GFA family protein [Pseudomonas syringae]NAO66861.1 GFA family protein [Pseudomonas syringae]NAO71799.1 GFA family protein [Pseudomonas syringae]